MQMFKYHSQVMVRDTDAPIDFLLRHIELLDDQLGQLLTQRHAFCTQNVTPDQRDYPAGDYILHLLLMPFRGLFQHSDHHFQEKGGVGGGE